MDNSFSKQNKNVSIDLEYSNSSFSIPLPSYLNLLKGVAKENPKLIKDIINDDPEFLKTITIEILKKDPNIIREIAKENPNLGNEIAISNPEYLRDLFLSIPQLKEVVPKIKDFFNSNKPNHIDPY